MSTHAHRGDRSKPPQPPIPGSPRHREGAEAGPAWTDADLARALEMFRPEQPSGPAFSGTSPTSTRPGDSHSLDSFGCETSSEGGSRRGTTNQTVDVQIAVARPVADTAEEDAPWSGTASIAEPPSSIAEPPSDVALIRSEIVVPQLARPPVELALDRALPAASRAAGHPSTWQWRAVLALAALVGVGIGVAGITIGRYSARLTTSEGVSALLSRPQSLSLASRALPGTAIVPSSVPMTLGTAVGAGRTEVGFTGHPSGLPPVASTESPSPPTAPNTPSSRGALAPSPPVLPTPPAAAIDVAPAAVPDPSPPVARAPVPSIAIPVREPEPSSPPGAPPMPVAPPATAISSSSASPPSAASPSSVAAAARATDTGAIETALSRYRSAFSVLDIGAAKAVWPTVDARALGRAFDRLQEQTLEFDPCAIDVTGARAVASCGGSARYVPKVGNKSPRTETRQWKFSLRKVNEEWLIESVASR